MTDARPTRLVRDEYGTVLDVLDAARPALQPATIGSRDKLDADKPRWDLLIVSQRLALEQVVEALTYGARKYGDDGFRYVKGAQRRYLAALMRHVSSFLAGERVDVESGCHHLAHATCSLLFLLELDLERELDAASAHLAVEAMSKEAAR